MPIEQFVSDYLDNELSEPQTVQAEELLQHDPKARRIHEEILTLRKAIRSIPREPVPADFQANLFKKIAAALPATADAVPARQKTSLWESGKKRLSNYRIWVYPLAVLIVGGTFYLFETFRLPQNGENIAVLPVEQSTNIPKKPEFYPPLSEGGRITGGPKAVMEVSSVEIFCQLTPDARKKRFFQRILAEQKIPSVTRANGVSANLIYEVNITAAQLKTLLEAVYADKESVLDIQIPYDLVPLFKDAEIQAVPPVYKVQFIIPNGQ
ncbi:MAG: hypothetical protein LBQ54_11605 [Planctomycetaceae bacterium]|nr:hypothetical protein [Planctomycetaceae bacterium]